MKHLYFKFTACLPGISHRISRQACLLLGMVCLLVLLLPACESKISSDEPSGFQYLSEQFADLQILRYKVPGFEELTLQQKEMLYYLYEAALSGRQ